MLESQLREIYARVVYTHKTHEKCADILNGNDYAIKVAQIILPAITSGSLLTAIIADKKCLQIISFSISAIMTVFAAYVKNFNPKGLAEKHSQAALKLWNIRESYLSLIVDLKGSTPDIDAIAKRRDDLQSQLHSVFKESPRTISSAYNKASAALKKYEEFTFSDEEIDKFLPEKLRITKRQ